MEQQSIVQQGVPNKIVYFFKWVGYKIAQLFEPEEVEVTIDPDGNYSYTKVQQKHA